MFLLSPPLSDEKIKSQAPHIKSIQVTLGMSLRIKMPQNRNNSGTIYQTGKFINGNPIFYY